MTCAFLAGCKGGHPSVFWRISSPCHVGTGLVLTSRLLAAVFAAPPAVTVARRRSRAHGILAPTPASAMVRAPFRSAGVRLLRRAQHDRPEARVHIEALAPGPAYRRGRVVIRHCHLFFYRDSPYKREWGGIITEGPLLDRLDVLALLHRDGGAPGADLGRKSC